MHAQQQIFEGQIFEDSGFGIKSVSMELDLEFHHF